jgi:hypothetical protein
LSAGCSPASPPPPTVVAPTPPPSSSTDPTAIWSVFQDFYLRRGVQERKVDISKYVDYSMINRAVEVMGRVSR